MRVGSEAPGSELFKRPPPDERREPLLLRRDLPATIEKSKPPSISGERKNEDAAGERPHDRSDRPDVRHMTPREMTELSQDLYAAGVLSFEEYSMLAFQSELQPDYDRTIGALTGQPAGPNRPRDFIAEWEDRLAFVERHNTADHRVIQDTRHILGVLKQIDRPTDMVV